MRRFLITSDKFTGTAEAIYNALNVLIKIDCSRAKMDVSIMRGFKRALPTTTEELEEGNCFLPGTIVIEADFEISLEDFKREYPYSRNYHLLPAIWSKMRKEEQVQAYFGAIEYRKYCEKTEWYNPKIAATWITKKEYLNEWNKM